jgi:hypothetical protein
VRVLQQTAGCFLRVCVGVIGGQFQI